MTSWSGRTDRRPPWGQGRRRPCLRVGWPMRPAPAQARMTDGPEGEVTVGSSCVFGGGRRVGCLLSARWAHVWGLGAWTSPAAGLYFGD